MAWVRYVVFASARTEHWTPLMLTRVRKAFWHDLRHSQIPRSQDRGWTREPDGPSACWHPLASQIAGPECLHSLLLRKVRRRKPSRNATVTKRAQAARELLAMAAGGLTFSAYEGRKGPRSSRRRRYRKPCAVKSLIEALVSRPKVLPWPKLGEWSFACNPTAQRDAWLLHWLVCGL